jgi:hypothetical protein
MVMIMVVILIGAITTVIAASVDLGRMAVYKQKQAEREVAWQYCVESGKAFVVEDLVALSDTMQSFSKTVNGIALSVSCSPDFSWNSITSTRVTVTGILEGKSRTTREYVGKRSTVNPCHFGVFFTSVFNPNSNITLTGDAFLAGSISASLLSVTGDLYCPSATAPTVASLTGVYVGRQPGQSLVLNEAKYAAEDPTPTSGNLTLNNPSGTASFFHSELRFHSGDLTIKGTTNGELTIYVKGSVTLDRIKNASSGTNRLVVICNGDVTIFPGANDVFVIASGKIRSSSTTGARTISGSLAGMEFSNTVSTYTVNFDDYFVTSGFGGYRYYIPGQW